MAPADDVTLNVTLVVGLSFDTLKADETLLADLISSLEVSLATSLSTLVPELLLMQEASTGSVRKISRYTQTAEVGLGRGQPAQSNWQGRVGRELVLAVHSVLVWGMHGRACLSASCLRSAGTPVRGLRWRALTSPPIAPNPLSCSVRACALSVPFGNGMALL